jgi:hypothetical protein
MIKARCDRRRLLRCSDIEIDPPRGKRSEVTGRPTRNGWIVGLRLATNSAEPCIESTALPGQQRRCAEFSTLPLATVETARTRGCGPPHGERERNNGSTTHYPARASSPQSTTKCSDCNPTWPNLAFTHVANRPSSWRARIRRIDSSALGPASDREYLNRVARLIISIRTILIQDRIARTVLVN